MPGGLGEFAGPGPGFVEIRGRRIRLEPVFVTSDCRAQLEPVEFVNE